MKCFRSLIFLLLLSCGSENKTALVKPTKKPVTPYVLKLDTYSELDGRELKIFGSCDTLSKVDLEIEQLQIKRSIFCYEGKFSTYVDLPVSMDGQDLNYKILAGEKIISKEVAINFDEDEILNDLEFSLMSKNLEVFSDIECTQKMVKKTGVAKCLKSGDIKFTANSEKSAPSIIDNAMYFNDSLLVNRQDLINGLDAFEVILVLKSDELATDAGILDVHRFERDDDVFSLRYDAIGYLSFCSECIKGAITTSYDTYYVESGSFTQSTQVSILGMSWSSGKALKTYYNGQQSISSNQKLAKGKIQAPETLYLGHGPKGSWNGKLYEFYFFKKELSEKNRNFLYNRLAKKYL